MSIREQGKRRAIAVSAAIVFASIVTTAATAAALVVGNGGSDEPNSFGRSSTPWQPTSPQQSSPVAPSGGNPAQATTSGS